MKPDPADLCRRVIGIAREAGQMIQQTSPGRIGFKGAIDLVTEADRKSEAFVVGALGNLLPEAAVLAEEGSSRAGDGGLLWVVDPLDGTTNFAHGYPVYAVAVALVEYRKPLLGVVYDPNRDECFHAVAGGGARLNGAPIAVTSTESLSRALLATGFPYDTHTSSRNNLPQFSAFATRARGLRRSGSAALDLSYVAAGRLDGFWEEKLSPWDILAGALLVREAGGRVTDYLGRELDAWQGHVVAGGEAVHETMLQVLAEVETGHRLGPLSPRSGGAPQ